jgi:hypothetical protein
MKAGDCRIDGLRFVTGLGLATITSLKQMTGSVSAFGSEQIPLEQIGRTDPASNLTTSLVCQRLALAARRSL